MDYWITNGGKRMTWFKYVWIVLLAIWYFTWTFVVWSGTDEKTSKSDWIAIHVVIIFFISFVYCCIDLLW